MIEWKKNRAVFFSRIERETWHAYEGNNQEERKVLKKRANFTSFFLSIVFSYVYVTQVFN